tara:strand:+ start:8233 stop:8379 length:147 start_codon:yes stop_codon:yes gene_type:complete
MLLLAPFLSKNGKSCAKAEAKGDFYGVLEGGFYRFVEGCKSAQAGLKG